MHEGVICDNCPPDRDMIWGQRFICRSCEDCDLCTSCFEVYKEGELRLDACRDHEFLDVPRPEWKDLRPGVVGTDGTTLEEWFQRLKTKHSNLES